MVRDVLMGDVVITRFGDSKNTMQAFLRFATFLLAASLAFAGSPKISKDLEGLEPGTFVDVVDVIVQFEKAPSEADFGAVRGRGATEKKRLPLIKSGVFSLPVAALAGVANNPAISYISPDRPVQASLDYAVETLGADLALGNGWDGQGVGVAIIDSGLYGHEDLKFEAPRVVYREGFIGRKVKDEFGHGTHVAGIVAGSGHVAKFYGSAKIFHGVAPGANLFDLRVLDANGQGTDSGVIAAIQRAIELKDQYNVRVINLSLGRRSLKATRPTRCVKRSRPPGMPASSSSWPRATRVATTPSGTTVTPLSSLPATTRS